MLCYFKLYIYISSFFLNSIWLFIYKDFCMLFLFTTPCLGPHFTVFFSKKMCVCNFFGREVENFARWNFFGHDTPYFR